MMTSKKYILLLLLLVGFGWLLYYVMQDSLLKKATKKAVELDSLEQYNEAIIEWSYVLANRSNDIIALTCRGVDYNYIGKYDKALMDLLQAYNLEEYNIVALINIANSYYLKGDYEKSLKYLNMALQKKGGEFIRIDIASPLINKHRYDVPSFIIIRERANFYEKLNQYLKAYKDIYQAIKSGYSYDSIYIQKDRLYSIVKDSLPSN